MQFRLADREAARYCTPVLAGDISLVEDALASQDQEFEILQEREPESDHGSRHCQ